MTVTQFDLCCKIVSLICARFQVSPDELESPSREWRITLPRWIAITLISRHTQIGTRRIGVLFKRKQRSITAALHGLERELETDCGTGRLVASLDAQVTTAVECALAIGN